MAESRIECPAVTQRSPYSAAIVMKAAGPIFASEHFCTDRRGGER